MNKILRYVADMLLTGAIAAVTVSCLKGSGFESSYQAHATLENYAELSGDNAYGEDKALFEIGYEFLVDDNISFFNKVDNTDNPTDYTGFALSRSTLEKSSSDGDDNGQTGEIGAEDTDTGGADAGEGTDDGSTGETAAYNRFTVNAESASSGSVFAVFYDNPNIEGRAEHVRFLASSYGTCTPVACMVNNTKEVADKIAEYNTTNDTQLEVKLTATGYLGGNETGDSSILLAGVRTDDETETTAYSIMDEWTVFDLSELGNIEYVEFGITVSASDAAIPAYFCIDDFIANVNISIAAE